MYYEWMDLSSAPLLPLAHMHTGTQSARNVLFQYAEMDVVQIHCRTTRKVHFSFSTLLSPATQVSQKAEQCPM